MPSFLGSRRIVPSACPSSNDGFALIDILVATLIFAIVAVALTRTLTTAFQARRTSQRWLTATALATERLERMRAADRTASDKPGDVFETSSQSRPVPGYPLLELAEVVVSWEDRGPRSFTLEAYVPVDE